MGLWDKIKKMFDTGGVKLEFETPGVFRWQDDALPVVVTLVNTTEEPRTVRQLTFEISESDREAPGSKAVDDGAVPGWLSKVGAAMSSAQPTPPDDGGTVSP